MSSQTNKDTVLKYQMAVSSYMQANAADADSQVTPDFLQYLAADVRWHLPKSMAAYGGDLFQGPEGIADMLLNGVRQYYDPASIEVDFRSMMAEGDLVHMHFGMTATTVNNQRYSNDYQVLYQLRDGKIVEVWEYFDAHQLINCLSA